MPMTKSTGWGRNNGPRPATVAARRARKCAAELTALLAKGLGGEGWETHAACGSLNNDLMYPTAEPGSARYDEQVVAAKALCATCPVRAQCLAHALSQGEEFGIWGGLDEDERREVHRARRRAALRPTGTDEPLDDGEEAA